MFTLVTHSLTHSVTLVNTIDVTLTCEYAYSKLGDVVTIADVDSEKRVDESLVQIWKLKFGHRANFFVQTLSTRFEAEVQSIFCC